MDLRYNKSQLPAEIAALLPDFCEEFTGDDADARVLAMREPGGPWTGGILQVNQEFSERDVRWQNMILLHELAHLLTVGRPGGKHDQPAGMAVDNGHDLHWLRIFALLMARSMYDIRDFGDEVDYILSFDLTVADIDNAMTEAGLPWTKINPDVFLQRLVDIGDERAAKARRGWRNAIRIRTAALVGGWLAAVGSLAGGAAWLAPR